MTASMQNCINAKSRPQNIRWTRRGSRTYYAEDLGPSGFQTFVFSGQNCWLWAWAVYARHFTRVGVEHSFQKAKLKASEAVADAVRPSAGAPND